MSSLVPRPDGLTFRQWLNWTTDALDIPPVLGVAKEENWKEVAMQLNLDPYIQSLDNMGYNNSVRWQDWAESLILAAENE